MGKTMMRGLGRAAAPSLAALTLSTSPAFAKAAEPPPITMAGSTTLSAEQVLR